MRIVSPLPSATEIVCALGLREQLVGVTHECDFPPSVRELPKVTHTLIPVDASSAEIDQLVRERLQNERALYSLDRPVLESLQPELIVTQALCDVCAVAEREVQAAACSLPGSPRVINLEPSNLDEVLESLRTVGAAVGFAARAEAVVAALRQRVDAVVERSARLTHRASVVILEWIDPPFSAGHWNPELVRLAGGRELLGRERERSQTLSWEQVRTADPECLVIACCGYSTERALADLPILEAFPGWREMQAVKRGAVWVVDGSAYFSRPGPRLVESLEILSHVLNPESHPLPPGSENAVVRMGRSFQNGSLPTAS